jgi:dTDP-glucose 4,6-dehydratase/UDP-glucose 4-epimerase
MVGRLPREALRTKQCLITGGLGFIGSNLARELESAGASVTLVDSLIPEYGGNRFNIADLEGRVTVNVSDVRDPHSIRNLVEGVDVLFNLAGQTSHLDSMTDPQTDLDINVGAQLSILEACRQANPDVRIVFASTRQIYGRPDYLPVDEAHPIRPVDVNGVHKVAGEWHHLLYERVYGLRTSALRLTNTYGPGMRVKDARQTFLGVWIRDVLTGRAVRVFGDGTQLRDFNHVDDVVEALLLAATRDEAVGKAYNLGSPEVISLGDLAVKLTGIVPGSTFELVPFPEDRKAIDIGDYFADHSLIERELGWTPRVDLGSGLQRTIDFYREHGEHYGIGPGQ